MSRISPLDLEQIPSLKPLLFECKVALGFIPNDGLIMARRPDIMKAFLRLVQSIYMPGEVDQGLKRLIGLISSNVTGCEYCQAHAANAANEHQEDRDRILAVWDFRKNNLFTLAEKAALEVALKSAMNPNQVSDEDFENLKEYYNENQIVEIVSVISMYGFLNRWNSTLKTDIEEKPQTFWSQIKKENNV